MLMNRGMGVHTTQPAEVEQQPLSDLSIASAPRPRDDVILNIARSAFYIGDRRKKWRSPSVAGGNGTAAQWRSYRGVHGPRPPNLVPTNRHHKQWRPRRQRWVYKHRALFDKMWNRPPWPIFHFPLFCDALTYECSDRKLCSKNFEGKNRKIRFFRTWVRKFVDVIGYVRPNSVKCLNPALQAA